MKKIVIIGAGGLAETALGVFERGGKFKVEAFAVDPGFGAPKTLVGRPVVGTADLIKKFPPARYGAFVAIAYSGMNRFRAERCAKMKKLGYTLVSAVGSKAVCLAKSVGDNCIVMDGALVETGAVLGDGAIVWGGAIVGHHTTLGEYSFVAIGSTIAGRVKIGARCFVGAGSVVTDNLSIGEATFIGAGALITGDTKPEEVHKTAPAALKKYKSSGLKRI